MRTNARSSSVVAWATKRRRWRNTAFHVTAFDISPPLRPSAIAAIARYVARDGLVPLIALGRDEHEDIGPLPWPLTKAELQLFAPAGVEQMSFDEFLDDETPPERDLRQVRRFKVLYRKAPVT